MRGQWSLIFGLIAALIIAVFAVINVEPVRVNYLFGTANWPLILVILGSVLMGGIIVGAVGMVKVYQLQQHIKRLKAVTKEQVSPPSLENEKKLREEQPENGKETK
ncbi:LapA family protein [Alkalihalobacterium bogoriense]|uniref:LapA family protein n=1 Tax=Alkalihalobacterium bogoriense TaxID=246272 RepID=UPI00047BF679|nr:lipopolysaccharide assembly protein LapA domain-containing protein [Alkalihalobacterium bogoriense]